MFVDEIAETVHDHQVDFLDPRSRPSGNPDLKVILVQVQCGFAAVTTTDEDYTRLLVVRSIYCIDDVWRTATRGKCQQDVARASECPDLFRKNIGELIVVGDRGYGRRIRRERDRGESRTLTFESVQHFRRKMLCIGSGTAVTASHDFTVRHQALEQYIGARGNRRGKHRARLRLYGDTLVEDAFDSVLGIHDIAL